MNTNQTASLFLSFARWRKDPCVRLVVTRSNINAGGAWLILIYSRTRLSFLTLFAAGTKQPTRDASYLKPFTFHVATVLLVLSCRLKRIISISEGCLIPLLQR